jgi:uncharacterized protein (TIGR02266 family)
LTTFFANFVTRDKMRVFKRGSVRWVLVGMAGNSGANSGGEMIPQDESTVLSQRRSQERVAARLSVQLHRENSTALREYSVNLSVGGLFLESEKLLEEGTPLVLHFELPDSRHIHCHARVAWVNDPRHPNCDHLPSGMGIQFVDLRPEDMEALREFVRKKLILPTW